MSIIKYLNGKSLNNSNEEKVILDVDYNGTVNLLNTVTNSVSTWTLHEVCNEMEKNEKAKIKNNKFSIMYHYCLKNYPEEFI